MPSPVISTARILNPKLIAQRLIGALQMRFVPNDQHVVALTYCTGISPAGAAAWLAGDVVPHAKNVLRICRYFRINTEWLLIGEGYPLADEDFSLLHSAWAHADERERAILRSIAQTILSRYPPSAPPSNTK